ncbi:MAG: hypothetical protein H6Q37_139 [Chloroflexi bacterium]|nr:hypothetical protein [Chloroflexota bacterium]
MTIDFTTEFGQRVLQRLQAEQCIWLTTVSPDGTPQPNPVWFLWEDETILIYTQPGSVKVRNIRQNPHVALNFNSTFDGSDVAVIAGVVEIDDDAPRARDNAPYLEKYASGIVDIQMNPESMSAEYSLALRIQPQKLRGF